MIRVFLLYVLMAVPALAQATAEPIVEIALDQPEVIPGQSASLRVTVLVPSWMLSPPEFPSFEAPNLRVMTPPRSGTSISRNIDGDTWSGVTRRFLLMPLVPGRFAIPAQEIALNYADSDGTTPIAATVATQAVTLTGVLPEGAEGLDPFIAASDLRLTQELSGDLTDLQVGNSVQRVITAEITGTSPMVLPTLIPSAEIPGIRVYPDSPKIAETQERGLLAGHRVESETLMAVAGGQGEIPAISLQWYDLDSKEIQTATIPAMAVTVEGDLADRARQVAATDWRLLAVILGGLVSVLLALWWILPRLRRYRAARQHAYRAGPGYAFRRLSAALHGHDYRETRRWLAIWLARCAPLSSDDSKDLSAAMAAIGAARYGQHPSDRQGENWKALQKAIDTARLHMKTRDKPSLPKLNPN
ncbi:BatD family protein [Paracoccus sp. Z330]|uniref:BatD family protein n=1 Tax=Paracoccus onchidii TaxID=3017813 RepID=A0ABT4ZG74_9RHOB|nr:BatD family protein [Paracoccus onchidii]MDB6178364.1 BatD family protein [Paracoccus onchidii]